MLRKGTRWRIDWAGEGSPEAGQLVRRVSAGDRVSFVRVLSVRVVRNIRPLPVGTTCRYAITVERLDGRPASGESCAWTCHAYASKPRGRSADPAADRWSPLL